MVNGLTTELGESVNAHHFRGASATLEVGGGGALTRVIRISPYQVVNYLALGRYVGKL